MYSLKQNLTKYLKEHKIGIGIIILIISSPMLAYVCKFYSFPFSDKTQDWTNFSSYVGGIYSSVFGLISILILCLTLYFTIKNNNAQQKNNNTQIEQLINDSKINLFISHVQALNEKLDKRQNKLHNLHPYIKKPATRTEEDYIEELRKRYNLSFSAACLDNPNIKPSPFSITYEVLTDLRVRYPQEITALLNILSMVKTCENSTLKIELIRLFHSLTYRDRTYWIVMYAFHVNEEAKKIIEGNLSLIAEADGLSK